MSDSGRNLPDFKAVQLDFAAHIRNPDLNPAPGDVEARRMKIYADLFFNNIKSFLDSAFPIAAEVVGATRWRQIVRDFVHLHPSESPYFLQISEEFLTFLHQQNYADLPGFLLELCHYEWVELSLDVAAECEQQPPLIANNPADPDFLMGRLAISTLVRALIYQYPVHEIGVSNQPSSPPATPTYLLVYRNADNAVRFLQSNPVTHRLLELLVEQDAATALQTIHSELSAGGRAINTEKFMLQGRQTLAHLYDLGIIQGEITNET
ncbi:MAG: putative DNA-binding domain-containing protein [Pseudomonadaceae bacterium]|nr:putative DNA-binding domain-containing protein [Pseudomonadaceae bacterium]